MMIENLVETHCHILPGIDDGAADVQTSLKMIESLKKQGAKTIILTPHYYSDSISLEDFLKRRSKAFDALKEALSDDDRPRLIPAAEVYISKYLFNNTNINDICIGDSGYILIEHPFSSDFSQESYDRLMNLYCDYGKRPVLAHIERYASLMDNPDLLDEYIAMGCLTQVNISSFVSSSRSIKKKLIKYMKAGRIHLIGSDCHNLTSRPPEYEKGVKEIIAKVGADKIAELENNARLLTGE